MSAATAINIYNALLTIVVGLCGFIAFQVWEINGTLSVVVEKQSMQEKDHDSLTAKVELMNNEIWNLKTKLR